MKTADILNAAARVKLAHWLRDCRSRFNLAHGAEGRQLARLLKRQCGIS